MWSDVMDSIDNVKSSLAHRSPASHCIELELASCFPRNRDIFFDKVERCMYGLVMHNRQTPSKNT